MDNIIRYIKDMYEWRKRNNLPKNAKRPGERPVRKPNENMMDYVIRIAQYNKELELWKTAPNIFDYDIIPEIEDLNNDIILENRDAKNESVKVEETQKNRYITQILSQFKEYREGFIAFILLSVLIILDIILDRFDWINIIFYPFLAAVIFVLLHGFIMPILFWFMNMYKQNEHKPKGNIINMFIAMLMLAFIGIPKENTTNQGSEEGNIVYICTGQNSKVYHQIPDCKGLQKCSENVIQIDVKEALDRGRHACKYCCD